MSEILVADDNPANLSVILRFLELLGHAGHSAANGREALGAVERGDYDLVLMDCQMPEMDGIEATRRIRALEASSGRRPIPIIALTASALSSDRELCRAAGMSDFLTKPVHLRKLGRTIASWLGDEEGLIENAEAPDESAPPEDVSSSEPRLDHEYLISLADMQSGGGSDLLGELVAHFRTFGPEIAQRIRTGLQTSDLESVRRSAHLFKSTCSHVGARRLASICEAIENRAASSLGSAAPAGSALLTMLVDQLESEFDPALRELEGFAKISA